MTPALLAALLLATSGLALVLVGLRTRQPSAIDDLLAEFELPGAPVDGYTQRLQAPLPTRLLRPVAGRISRRLQGLLPSEHLTRVREKLVLAGLGGRTTAEEHLAAQVVGAAAGAVAGLLLAVALAWSPARLLLAGVAGALLGVAVPMLRVRQHREKRVESIERDLPEILDLLAISVEAGVGLEGAMQSVAERFEGPLGDELAHTLSEMELGSSRRDALTHLRERTRVPDLDAFVLSLLQATELGMPLTRVLRTEADEMRRRRRQRVREAAAKLPVKLVFPLIVFVMPALFVVIIGPAVVRIGESVLGG